MRRTPKRPPHPHLPHPGRLALPEPDCGCRAAAQASRGPLLACGMASAAGWPKGAQSATIHTLPACLLGRRLRRNRANKENQKAIDEVFSRL
jgi:hypothetical protein